MRDGAGFGSNNNKSPNHEKVKVYFENARVHEKQYQGLVKEMSLRKAYDKELPLYKPREVAMPLNQQQKFELARSNQRSPKLSQTQSFAQSKQDIGRQRQQLAS